MIEQDLRNIKAVLEFLAEGWSVNVASKKAGLSVKEYKALKEMYPEFKMKLIENYQHGRPGWVRDET